MENSDNIDEQKSAVHKKKMKIIDIDEHESALDKKKKKMKIIDIDEHEKEENHADEEDEVEEIEMEMETEKKIEVDEQQQPLVSSFLEVVAGQTVKTAVDYLQATNWKVEDAVRLYYSQDVRGGLWGSSQSDNSYQDEDDNEDSGGGAWQNTFHVAKQVAETQDRWLIVNVQSKKEFSSHELDLHTWGNEAVAQTIGANFIFWQVYDDVTEGQKLCTYYKLTSFPAILVLDPITGQNVKSWTGMVEAVQLLEDLAPFMDAGPKHHYAQLYPKRPSETSQTSEKQEATVPVAPASIDIDELMIDEPVTSSSKKVTYPDLPEEPMVEKALLCRVGVRLPDGRRLQRNFLRTDPLQLLWSFCSSQLDEAESRPFQLTQAIPGASKILDFESKQTFEESGLANSMIYFAWD
ncbi:plant UBX domain-containing protein 7-like [Papaver somniferum]|uniref:plant UBX domain-containing protein 7-like n=1 Tax=Papaver somniferum TaxID=3469 RepID=UPI000E6F5E81|nr:plant UBX domain-containing protein 7-like [Papaver somniferum]